MSGDNSAEAPTGYDQKDKTSHIYTQNTAINQIL